MALLLLASAWARRQGLEADALTVLTVDHALRPEAAAEAEQVTRWTCALGHPSVVLRREGKSIPRNIQAEARAARLGLMTEWCRKAGVQDLLLAHHRDDQAETVLLRLARGSGVHGLAAMSPAALHGGAFGLSPIRLLRPLLDVPKARLLATLRGVGQAWIEDPSNVDERFARARLRRLMPALAREGLTAERLAATARRVARAREALDAQVESVLARTVQFDPAGFARLNPALLREAPEEVGLRVLVAALQAIGAERYPPRLERTERLYHAILTGSLAGGCTLAGCRAIPDRDRSVLVVREAAAVGPALPLEPGGEGVWDGRFAVALDRHCSPGEVRALGLEGWSQIRKHLRNSRSVPGPARETLPALWQGGTVAAVPALGFARPELSEAAFRARFPLWRAPI